MLALICECRDLIEITFPKRSHGNRALSELTSEPLMLPSSWLPDVVRLVTPPLVFCIEMLDRRVHSARLVKIQEGRRKIGNCSDLHIRLSRLVSVIPAFVFLFFPTFSRPLFLFSFLCISLSRYFNSLIRRTLE